MIPQGDIFPFYPKIRFVIHQFNLPKVKANLRLIQPLIGPVNSL